LDEIEKAHPDAFNILLQVLDDGRLTDNKGRVANFKNSIIIMTSNLGGPIIQDNYECAEDFSDINLFEKTKTAVLGLVRKALKPEFINRIDETIMFMPLGKEAIREIVKIQLLGLEKTLKEKDIYIEFSNEVIDHLSTIGFDPQYGARPVKRVLQKEVMNALSKEILSQRVSIGDHIILDQFDGKFIFRKAKEAIH
jgi:ATP-dependent Clp protease ATP-binding subunit ClpB